jgi:hypothetical protein
MNLENIGYFIPDVDPLYPSNMDLFWDIWNSKKELLTKVRNDNLGGGNDIKSLYQDANFEGMITWMKTDNYLTGSTWKQNLVLDAPDMWQQYVDELEEKMPWYKCDVIVLWACVKPVHYHMDPAPLGKAPVAIRSLIYDNNPTPTFKLRHNTSKEEKFVPYTKERNTFAFNNANFFHGANFLKDHYKVLMKTFGSVHNPELLIKQIKESKDKGLIWEVTN